MAHSSISAHITIQVERAHSQGNSYGRLNRSHKEHFECLTKDTKVQKLFQRVRAKLYEEELIHKDHHRLKFRLVVIFDGENLAWGSFLGRGGGERAIEGMASLLDSV